MVGKTGTGKSATGNTIAGKTVFNSALSASSVTKVSQGEYVKVDGRYVYIIDTPGIFSAADNQNEVKREIVRCIHLGAPKFNSVLFVIELKRYSLEDKECIETFLKFFDENMINRVIIVFTRYDELIEAKISLDDYIETSPKSLQDFVNKCGRRIIGFNNKLSGENRKHQVLYLKCMIENLESVHSSHASDNDFKRAEKSIELMELELKRKEVEQFLIIKAGHKEQITIFKQELQNLEAENDKIELLKKNFQSLMNEEKQKARNCEKEIEFVREKVRRMIINDSDGLSW